MRAPLAWALVAAFVFPAPLHATFSTSSFGQNKVNLRDFDWKTRETEHFTIYYYDDSAPWLDATARALEDAYRQETAALKVSFGERRSFFLYANVNDMEQSNIVTVGDGTGGVTEPLKDRFMAYADGSENWIEDVIHHEFTHVCQFRVLIDGFWRSARILKSFVYPIWFMEGMAEYDTGTDDKTLEDEVVRDRAVDGKLIPLPKLQALAALKPHEVTTAYKEGAAAIRFLADQYGQEKVGDLLRAFVNRFDATTALAEVINTDLDTFDKKFREYEKDVFSRQVAHARLEEPKGRALTRTDDSIPQFNTSPAFTPDGGSVVLLTTRDGFNGMVDMLDLATGERRNIVGHEYGWIENVPLGRFTDVSRNLSVSPDGRTAAFIGQKNHRDRIFLADLRTERISWLAFPGMMTIEEPAFSPDGGKIAFAGMKDGRTDIYLFDLETRRLENLTDSPDDDQSPSFSPDGTQLVWSKEVGDPSWNPTWQRDIMIMDLKDRKVRRLTELQGSARDPSFSPDGKKVVFTGDPDFVHDIYELELETGKVVRRTRSIGGSYDPSYAKDGKSILYSAYRHNSVTVYLAPITQLLDEDVTVSTRRAAQGAPAIGASKEAETPRMTDTGPARFKYSTDIFIPAFFYSSYGGLFWSSYYEGSDYLGNHNLTNFIDYNSGSGYLNYTLNYTYSRYRPQWVVGGTGLTEEDVLDELTGLNYNVSLQQQYVGVQYPFDRFHRLELTAGSAEEVDQYTSVPVTLYKQTRSLEAGIIRDTAEGRYLVETRGSRFALQYTHGFDELGGNQRFDTTSIEAQQFVPMGGQSTLAFRTVGVFSYGPNAQLLPLGGPGLVRGYQQYLLARAGTSIAFSNVEFRFPLAADIDFNLPLIADIYFKALYGTVFYDIGYAWSSNGDLYHTSWEDVAKAAGLGLRLYTFVLQRFEFIGSFDYAQQLTGQNHIFYIYLGPLF